MSEYGSLKHKKVYNPEIDNHTERSWYLALCVQNCE